jgi:hypothetical protein
MGNMEDSSPIWLAASRRFAATHGRTSTVVV